MKRLFLTLFLVCLMATMAFSYPAITIPAAGKYKTTSLMAGPEPIITQQFSLAIGGLYFDKKAKLTVGGAVPFLSISKKIEVYSLFNFDVGSGDTLSNASGDAGFGLVYGGPLWIGCLIDPVGVEFGTDFNPITYFAGATGFMAGYSWPKAGVAAVYKRIITEAKPKNQFGIFAYLNL